MLPADPRLGDTHSHPDQATGESILSSDWSVDTNAVFSLVQKGLTGLTGGLKRLTSVSGQVSAVL